MRNILTFGPMAAAILGLAACTNPPPMPNPANPAGTQAAAPSAGSASQMPQSPNSVPANTNVSAPTAPATGVIGRTQVR